MARYIDEVQQYETPLQKFLLSIRMQNLYFCESNQQLYYINMLVYQLLKLIDLLTMQYAPLGSSMC